MSPLSELLSREGVPIYPYTLSPGSRPIGETAILSNSEITYRQDAGTLIIILYRSLSRPSGLANAFMDMKWLLNFIRHRAPDIRTLATTAMAIEHLDGGAVPAPDKLLKFYQWYFNAVDAGCRDGQQWLRLDLPREQANP
ncbi:hypothetical protein BTA51_13980 [Hahella sp. CCB-MM4]|uniref:hypothetical protein n=1 Tax=Hahella sp. (strain CCB-MM4) TaxID=1926491 RepID=UPI000B9B7042|nr:hypothetical protein [Hahella sp. CCB-MM4]OZG72634.1 hypothetical protein BTA51_13980 [Hahella sp. CCB-MM4]